MLAPEVYRGADGAWLDVAFGGPGRAPGPAGRDRAHYPARAGERLAPPPSPHANGARGIARIDTEAEDPERLSELLRRIAGAAVADSSDIAFGKGVVRVRAAGRAGTRIAAVIIDREPGAAAAPASQTTDNERVVIDGREIRLLPRP